MNSAQILYDRHGIISQLDSSGRVWFSNMRKGLSPTMSGDCSVYKEVSELMIDVEQNAKKYLHCDKRIIVTGDRQVLVLYPKEVRQLALSDPDLYVTALRRGKNEKRMQETEKRR